MIRRARHALVVILALGLLAAGVSPSWASPRGTGTAARKGAVAQPVSTRTAADLPKPPKPMTQAQRKAQLAREQGSVAPMRGYVAPRPLPKKAVPHARPSAPPAKGPAAAAQGGARSAAPRTAAAGVPNPAWVSAYATAYPAYLSIGGQVQFGAGTTAASYNGAWLYVLDEDGYPVYQEEIKRSTGDPTGKFLDVGMWCYGWWPANSYPADQCFWWASNTAAGPLQDGKKYYAWIFMEGTDGSTSPGGTTSALVTAFYTPGIPGSQVGICTCYAQTERADPVNTATGTYFEKATDARLIGAGRPLTLERYYRSDSSATGLLGRGWSTPYDEKLTLTANDATLRTADGSQVTFLKLANGTYAAPVGTFLKLTVSGSTYTVADQDHSTSVFDSSGRLTALRDTGGHGLTLAYTSGRLSSVTDAAGRTTAFAVGTDGLLTGVTLPDATTVGYGYTSGLLTSATDPAGKTTAYGYDSAQRLTTATDPTGARTVNTYNANGRVATQTDPDGKKTTFTWDGSRTTSTTDASGGVWSDVYSGNVLVESIDPYGHQVSYDYDQALHPVDITDRLGNTTSMTYDAAGRILTRTAPSDTALSESWTYDAAGNVATHTDSRGTTTSFTYNAAGQPVTATDPAGKAVYTYDALGSPATVTSPRGKVTTYGYDGAGNRTSVTTPMGEKSTFTYDAAGHVLTKTDPRGNVSGADPAAYTTTYAYDAHGLLSSVTDPLGRTTAYGYDEAGELTSVEDALGRTTSYTYDPAGNVLTSTDPAGKTTAYTYDEAGDTTSVTDPLGHTTSYTYDENGNLLTTVSPRGNVSGADKAAYTTSYAYDANGNQTRVTDPTGAVTSTAYDSLGRPVAVTDPLGRTTRTTYDGNDNVLTTTDPLGKVTTYGYDTAGRLTSLKDPLGRTTTYGNDADGNRTSEKSPLGATTTWTFDADGRTQTQVDPRGNATGATAAQFTTTYGYDPAGNQTSVTDPLGKQTVTAYDALSRPVSVTDPLGRTTTSTYDKLGHLTEVTGPDAAVTTYTYNATGTMATRKDPNGHTTHYAYDDAGRQTAVTDPLGRTQSVDFDADGNPVTTTDARGITTTSAFDGRGLRSGTGYSDGTPSVAYTYFADGQPQTVTDATGKRTYGYDADGRLTSVTPSTGAGALTYGYDADGRITSRTQAFTAGTALDWTGATQTAAADLNGDGISDLVRTDAANGVRTFLGHPDGTFTAGSTLTGSGTGFTQVLPVEYTGDGKTDLLAIDKSTGHLLRYNGNGSGGFAAPFDLGAGWGAMTLTAGDFNGDGKQDFLASAGTASELYFYPGKGDGTFGTRTDIGPGWAPYRLTALEYNGDGKLDVLAINSTDGHLYFYPGTGTGILGTRTDLGKGWGNFRLAAGDFTGDGKQDFAADDTGSHKLYVYPGNGAGNFTARITEADDWTSYGVPVTGRLDAGTTLDIAATDTSGHLRWWSGDGTGNLTGATVAAGTGSRQKTTYGYDDDSRQTTQTDPAGTTSYAYDVAGNLTATTLPASNGYVEKRGYDNDGRLTSISSVKGTTTLTGRTVTLDAAGRPTRVDVTHAGKPTNYQYYAYDPAGRLLTDCTSATAADTCPDTAAATTYTYDDVGNRLTQTAAGTTTTYHYDDADQLTTAVTGTTTRTYTYDKDGNQTGDGTNTFAYDATGHLTSLTTPAGAFSYGYDADGNRVTATKTGSGLQRTTVWDPNGSLPQAVADYSGTGTLTAAYQYSPLEQIQSQTLPAGAASFDHHDQLGSVTDLTDATGGLQSSWTYTAYGESTRTDTATTPPANPFTYTGQYAEPTTSAAGLDLRARNYDPTTGRFTSTDPIALRTTEPYASAYGYAGDGPTYAVDPSGQDWRSALGSRLKAIGSGLKEGAELPFTVIGDLGDVLSGSNGGASRVFDKYLPIRPAYRLYRAAEMLRQQGCDQLADQYDAAGDQLVQQILLVGLGGLKGWEKDVAESIEPSLNVGNLRFGAGGGGVVNYLRGKLSYKTPETPELKSLVNPQGGGENCRACAVAVDKLLADGAPSSAPGALKRGPHDPVIQLYGGKPFLSKTLGRIVSDIKDGGDGARGIVWGYSSNGDSHVFNVVNVKGDVIFLDGQTGHANPRPYRSYGLLRTDK